MSAISTHDGDRRTAWSRSLAAPVRSFLAAETGGAAVMVAAAVIALVWANSPWRHAYGALWSARLTVEIAHAGVSTDLRHWVNEGLMTFFFLVVGLEAKRELDLGELRERRRLLVPALAAVAGLLVPIGIYVAANAGGPGARGWGAAMSTDTAFALAAIGLLTPRAATRTRVFLLTFSVVDDLCALGVISVAYTRHIAVVPLAAAIGLLALLLGLRYAPVARRVGTVATAVALWVAMFKSGVDPVVSGLVIGLATSAYTPAREDLELATSRLRSFREQPTPELARSAQEALLSALSRNERLQYELHPWTSYVIVPLFALANTGVHFSGSLLRHAVTSPITLGIFGGYVLGKPIGVMAGSWVATRPALRGPRSPLSSPLLLACGTCAGIGFTVSLLISSLAFTGMRLDEAKLGALASVVVAPLLTAAVLAIVRRLPSTVRASQISRTADDILDLAADVDPERDHIRGPEDAAVTLLEYGDFECPFCGQAESAIREVLSGVGADVRYVWRHLPLSDVHPQAQLAAEAAEAAAAQGRFWDMHDLLLSRQDALSFRDLVGYARELGLDTERFIDELRRGEHAARVGEDVSSADESGVSGTPTFFVNGRRHYGVYDVDALTTAVRAAKLRAHATQAREAVEVAGEG